MSTKTKVPTGPAGTSNVGDMFDLLDNTNEIDERVPSSSKPLLHISPIVKSKMGKVTHVLQPGQMTPAWDCIAWATIADVSMQVMAAVSLDDHLVSKRECRSFTMEELQGLSQTPPHARNINLQRALETSVLGGGAGGVYTLRLPQLPVGLVCDRDGLTQWGERQWERAELNPLEAYIRLRDSDDRERLWMAEHPRFYIPCAKGIAGMEIYDLASKKTMQVQELMLPMSLGHAWYHFGESQDSEQLLIAASVASLKLDRIYFGIPGDADKTAVTEDAYWAGDGEPPRKYQFDYHKDGPPLAAVFPRFKQQVCAAKSRDWKGKTVSVLQNRAVNRGAPTGFHDLHGLRT